MTSSIASLAYNIYYAFYPAYMTGLWHASVLQIAWYTVVLSSMLAISSAWINPLLSNFFSSRQLVIGSMPIIGLILLMLLLLPSPTMVLVLFAAMGIVIAISSTNYTLQVSETADTQVQGEVFGTPWGVRMLLDGCTSLIGGFLIIIAYSLPLACAALFVFVGWVVYCKVTKK